MIYLFESISEEMFKEKVVIRFDNINEGFNRFTNFMLESKCEENCEAESIEFLKKALKLKNINLNDFNLLRKTTTD